MLLANKVLMKSIYFGFKNIDCKYKNDYVFQISLAYTKNLAQSQIIYF